MSFIWPFMALVLLPLGVILYLWFQRRRRQIVARYGSLGLVQTGTASGLGWRRHVPAVFFFLGLTALVFALARPQTVVSLPRVEGTVMLVFDVSGSMAAEDFEPTRMEAAKAAATTFVQKQPTTVQIGVVAFSDGGLAVQAAQLDQAVEQRIRVDQVFAQAQRGGLGGRGGVLGRGLAHGRACSDQPISTVWKPN
jgi:Ca-activated chloride channel family protein